MYLLCFPTFVFEMNKHDIEKCCLVAGLVFCCFVLFFNSFISVTAGLFQLHFDHFYSDFTNISDELTSQLCSLGNDDIMSCPVCLN